MSNMDKFIKMPDNGKIGDGIEISFQVSEKNEVVWAWIGSKQAGPMLQYAGSGEFYNGMENVDWLDGAWTPIYSRGDFKMNFSHGGHWSGHTKSLHKRIADGDKQNDVHFELLGVPGVKDLIVLPEGIQGDISATQIDCSMSWAIFYKTAKQALEQRLLIFEIESSSLPMISKTHYIKNETKLILDNLQDAIETYKL